MSVIIGNKYEIINLIGEGSFGKVFKSKNINTNQDVAIKIQHKGITDVLKHEAKIYKYLSDVSGIPIIKNYGMDNGYNYLVLDLLDYSLDNKNISCNESIKYFINSLNIIEIIHSKGVLHRDIKPDNFLIKNINDRKELYIIDFGLSKLYIDSKKKHIEERNDRKLIGTIKYASPNLHNKIEASRRDDIISICYSFILIYNKKLPWDEEIERYYREKKTISKTSGSKINSEKTNSENINEIYNKIKEKKERIELLYDLPGEFITILLYCKKLKFLDKPNYKYLRGILENLLLNNSI